MVKHTSITVETEQLDFVKKAQDWFNANPSGTTFTLGGAVNPGEYFAVRWGIRHDCILVFRIDEGFEPKIYGQVLLPMSLEDVANALLGRTKR